MKADDYLEKATRELRETGEAPPSEVDAVRARILGTMRKSGRRPARTMLWVLPIAAVLAASTALATSGTSLRQVWHQLLGRAHVETTPPAPVEVRAAPRAPETRAPETRAPEPIQAPEPPAPVAAPVEPPTPVAEELPARPAAPEAPRPAAKVAARPSATRPEREAPPVESINTPEPEADRDAGTLSLYKRAHKLHFQDQNWAQALDAWNDYLREQPNGSLSVEARYNRALALARLGRRDEARAALTPFARGEVAGGYRAAEAKSLLTALEGSAR
jgi:hypothetical protein